MDVSLKLMEAKLVDLGCLHQKQSLARARLTELADVEQGRRLALPSYKTFIEHCPSHAPQPEGWLLCPPAGLPLAGLQPAALTESGPPAEESGPRESTARPAAFPCPLQKKRRTTNKDRVPEELTWTDNWETEMQAYTEEPGAQSRHINWVRERISQQCSYCGSPRSPYLLRTRVPQFQYNWQVFRKA
eukprot:g24932.t1